MPPRASVRSPYAALPALDAESGDLNVVIETPKGSRNKYTFDEQQRLFKLSGVLPAGAVFPFDFGFVLSTLGGDGDPLDVLLLMYEPVFTGCLVAARLIGVIEAEQTEQDGETNRNDRLIAVAAESQDQRDVRALSQLSDNLLDEIEHFFISYNQQKGKQFKPTARAGARNAMSLIEDGVKRFKQKQRRSAKR